MSAFDYVSIGLRFGRPSPADLADESAGGGGRGPLLRCAGSFSVFKTPAVVSGLVDMAVVPQTVEQDCGHLGITKHVGPYTEPKGGGGDNAGLLIELAQKMERSAAGLATI
jgi:hypothetical protein